MNTHHAPRTTLLRLWTLALGFWTLTAFGQTTVVFPLLQMTGTTNDTTVIIRPVNNPVSWHSNTYWLPTSGIELQTTNGSATTALIPNDYLVNISGVPGSWKISVNDTNITLNAALIGNLTTYAFTQPLPGVTKINAGANVTISPANGMGVVTINSTGGSGGTATNAYQSATADTGLTITTNNSVPGNFFYTFALNSALELWAGVTPNSWSNGVFTAFSGAFDSLGAAAAAQTYATGVSNLWNSGSNTLQTQITGNNATIIGVSNLWNSGSNNLQTSISANAANVTSVSNQWLNGSNNFNTSINLRLTTNDTRNVSLNGSFLGTLTMSNSTLLSGTANPFRIGFNSGIGPYVDGNTAGQEVLVNMISPWENAWNFNNGYPFLSFYSGVHGDYTFRFYKLITGKPTLNPDPTKFAYDGLNYGNIGAPQTVYAPYYGGSAASMVDLPSHDGQAFRTAMPRPWLGASTDDPTHTESDSNPGPQQTNFLYLTNMSYYFETSGITAALNAYGTAPNIWGDCGWEQTNRTTDGVIQENKALFPFGLSNEVAIVHSHGTTITLHIYHTANQPNQFPNISAATPDTAWRTSLGGHFKNSYPSGTGADAGYQTNFTYPAIDAFSSKIDTLWYYTNGIDGLDDADIDSGEAESQAYEHYRLVKDADAILYPQTKNSGRVYWRNWTRPDGSGNNAAIDADVFTNTTALRHQLWLGIFANHASSETPYYANFIATDQGLGQVGADPGLSSAMSYAQTYENMGSTNWAPGTFGLFSLSKGGAFDGNFTAANYTNGYSVIGEFNGCGTSGWYTNSWNTNQNVVVTNSNFLSVWTDTTGGWPKCVFSDPFVYSGGVAYTGTNSLWIRQLKDGYAVLAANLGAVSSNYNSSLVISGGIASNQVYFATNIFSQTPFGSGLLTNNFIGTIGAASPAWVKLTPYSINGNFVGNGAGVTNTPFSNLNLSLVIGSGSNNVVGYLNFTNNGIHYTIPVCTNAVP